MGTDIYLRWDGQTRAEKKRQFTGFSIQAGNVGYLRASIGMETENAVLREVFPLKLWEDAGKYIPFDFNQGWAVVQKVAKKYLATCLFGIPFEKSTAQVEHEQWVKQVEKVLTGKKKWDKIEVSTLDNDLPSAIMWLDSLYQFIELGIDKQEKKLNPKVMISW